jgi:hypothetical protein
VPCRFCGHGVGRGPQGTAQPSRRRESLRVWTRRGHRDGRVLPSSPTVLVSRFRGACAA